ELTLTFTEPAGRERRIVSQAPRITLGRAADNDIVIDDANLSRNHAVIENAGDSIQVSDCNSRNGTMVNGHPLVGPVELFDGDIVNLGGSCDITVGLRRSAETPSSSRVPVPAIAVAAVAAILVCAGALLALAAWRKAEPVTSQRYTNNPRGEEKPEPSPEIVKTEIPREVVPEDPKNDAGTAVKRVMSKLSKDNAPYISEAGINDVKRKVDHYRGSTELKERLRQVKQGCSEIRVEAERISLRPALVMYAALAKSEEQPGSNPIIVARQMTPKLLSLRATFGTETANSSLLLIAAYPYPFNPPIGGQTRTPHPLASKLVEVGGRRSIVDTSEARTVWFLHEKNAITDEAYELVIRLLAIGVIAQNPSQYGIDAEPPLC
ncbi:MAG TPA: FHA domain-containing protein, partial [Pyrinomonadaceae bacterium]|nr:FHA domain-containing protein [Pyrinomonadaceae bacterium]